MGFRVRNYIPTNDPFGESKTELQWQKEFRALNEDAVGEVMWSNQYCALHTRYYKLNETHLASSEEKDVWRRRRNDQAKVRRQKKKAEKQAAMLQKKERESKTAAAQAVKIQKYSEIPRDKIICLDLETIGLDPQEDEILQLAIINGVWDILFNQFFRPKHIHIWTEAELVNGITPESAMACPFIDEFLPAIKGIIQDSDLIVGYNIHEFDLRFLRACGIEPDSPLNICDMMLEFASIFGEWDSKRKNFRFKSLSICADYYGYSSPDPYHNALADCRATLFCFFTMIEAEKLSPT